MTSFNEIKRIGFGEEISARKASNLLKAGAISVVAYRHEFSGDVGAWRVATNKEEIEKLGAGYKSYEAIAVKGRSTKPVTDGRGNFRFAAIQGYFTVHVVTK